MANLPRFGRARQRLSSVPPPVPAAAHPAVEPKYEILPFATTITTPAPASPRRESPRPLYSPPKKATSPLASPKYGDHSRTRVDSSPAAKATRSSPDGTGDKYFERRNGETTPPLSPAKSRRAKTPPLSPLALPRSQVITGNGTTAQPRVQPEVETKGIVYNKAVEKPSKSNRPSEYGSGKSHQKQQPPEVIKLKGHNVGAVMEINKSSAGYRLGGETLKKNETEDVGVVHGHGHEDKKTGRKKEPPITAFMNSNFQSVNNSLLFDSSCNHRDPGLHLAFPDAVDSDRSIGDGHKSYKPKRHQ